MAGGGSGEQPNGCTSGVRDARRETYEKVAKGSGTKREPKLGTGRREDLAALLKCFPFSYTVATRAHGADAFVTARAVEPSRHAAATRSMKSSATRAPGCEIIPVAAPRCTISMRRKTRYHFVKRAMAAPPGFIERPLFGGAIVAFLPASFKVRGTLAATAGCFAERLVTSQDSSPLPARPPARPRPAGRPASRAC